MMRIGGFKPGKMTRPVAGPVWEARDDDPQFVARRRVRWPAFFVIELDAMDAPLQPVLYLDFGDGFSEANAMRLRQRGRTAYVVAARRFRGVRALRIDPMARKGRFRAGFAQADSLKALRADLRARRLSAGREGTALHVEAVAGWDRAASGEQSYRSVADHARKLFAMAAAEASSRPLPAWDGSRPLISFVVPVFNTPAPYLDQLLASFDRQGPISLRELVLSDDGSTDPATLRWLSAHRGHPGVILVREEVNGGIGQATNRGMRAARGLWIGFLDHDDALAPHALDRLRRAMAAHPEAELFFTDEMIADAKLAPIAYYLKPAFDRVLLSGVNYVNHLTLYRHERLRALGPLREDLDGGQDYELLLRYTADLADDRICHVPYPAYVWRRDGTSYSAAQASRSRDHAREALARHWRVPVGQALSGDLHRLLWHRSEIDWPPVSVVIPTRDSPGLVATVLEGVLDRTDYPGLRVILVDNGSKDPGTFAVYDRFAGRVELDLFDEPFNFSRSVNRGLARAGQGHVLLLNDDVQVVEPGWLKEMVGCLAYPDTGIVGARLLYPDGTLQHAGVIVGFQGLAGHWFPAQMPDREAPLGRLHVRGQFSAVTGACMLLSRACIDAVGGFDEQNFAIAYNDVDYCLRAASAGFRTVWTPFATLTHHESASRGSDDAPERRDRFEREQMALRAIHDTEVFEDPAFSPWYSSAHGDPRLRLLDHLPASRPGFLRSAARAGDGKTQARDRG